MKEFIKYINSISESNEILALEDTAKNIKRMFYEFFEQPIFEKKHSEEDLSKLLEKYEQINKPVKKLLNEYRNARESQKEMKKQKREAIRILKGIVSDLDSSIEKINQSISLKKKEKQIKLSEEAIKKANCANIIAFIALAVAIILPLVLFVIGWFCGNQ